MPLTPSRQRNAVSQGVALGLLLHGRNELPADKVDVDLAFEGAWKSWAYRGQFSQVNTDLAKGLDGLHAITQATRAKQVVGVWWERGSHGWVIVTGDSDWAADRPADVEYALQMIGADVSVDGWKDLAEDFLSRAER